MNKVFRVFSLSLIVGVFVFGSCAFTAKAATIAELQAQINTLLAQIQALQQQLNPLLQGQSGTWCHKFNTNLKIGDKGAEVIALQTALSKEGFYAKSTTGNFDEYTASAVVGFQEKYASEILTPWRLERGTGFVGATTRDKLNKLYGCGVTPPSSTLSTSTSAISTSSTSTSIISCNPGQKVGDVNGDGKIDTDDSNLATRVSVGSQQAPSNLCCIDLNHDNVVDIFDVILIQRITNGLDQSTTTCPISVQPSIKVLSPNGGEIWVGDQTYTITWLSSGVSKIKIAECAETPLLATKYTCRALPGIPDAGIDAGLKYYKWSVDPNDPFLPGAVKIKIWDVSNPSIYDESNNYFSIVAPTTTTSCARETTKAGVTCGGYFYGDYCENLSDGTGYVAKRKCNAATGIDCSGLVNVDRIFCPYGCQNGICKPITVTSTSTSIISCNPGQKVGDVNGDGKIDIDDSVLAEKVAVGSQQAPSNLCCIDLNHDNVVDISDVILIQRITNGLDQSTTTCPTITGLEEAQNKLASIQAAVADLIQKVKELLGR